MRLRESGYYPAGAEFDSRAPYNQPVDDEDEEQEEYEYDWEACDRFLAWMEGKAESELEERRLALADL